MNSFISNKVKDTEISNIHGSLMEKNTAVGESQQQQMHGSLINNSTNPNPLGQSGVNPMAYNLEDSLMTNAQMEQSNFLPSQIVE